MRYLLPVAVLFVSAPAFAQTVDDGGTAQLEQDLSRYLGQEVFSKGVVRVAAEGGAYRIMLDLSELSSLLPEQDMVNFSVSPYAVIVKPRDDGSWDVSLDGTLSGSWEINTPEGQQSSEWKNTDVEWSGVYDPLLVAFTSASGSFGTMTMSSRDPIQEVQASFGRSTFEMTGSEGAKGGVDVVFAQEVDDFTETIDITDPDTGQVFSTKITAPTVKLEGDANGFRTKALLDLLAFAVANSDEDDLVENQAELKSLLLAALPLWERMEGAYQFQQLTVETSAGTFGAAEVGVEGKIDGIRKDGTIDQRIAVTDLRIPDHLLPAWSASLLPTSVNLNIGGVDLNLEDTVRRAIEVFDLNEEPPIPADVGEQIADDFLANPPRIVISRSTVSNAEMEVVFDGEMVFRDGVPETNLTVEVAGYDKIVAALQRAAQKSPEASEYVAMALGIKGFGETTPDGHIKWAVNQVADGSVMVNGVMIKPPD